MPDKGNKKALKYILSSAALLLASYLVYFLSEVFIVLAISVLISFILHPFVNFLEQKGLNRSLSTGIVFLLLCALFYSGLSTLIPALSEQFSKLYLSIKNSPIQSQFSQFEKDLAVQFPFLVEINIFSKLESFISGQVLSVFDQLTNLLSSIISVIAILVIVPFITFYILKDHKTIYKGILNIIPNKYFEMSYWILKKISIQLGKFVRAWIFDAAFVGVSCGLGFYLLGIENALSLGIIAGLGHLVPYFGPVIGGIPAVIISIIQYNDFSHIPGIALLLVIIYTLDNGIVQPLVFSKSVDMHPIIIILLIITGSQIAGIMGMLFAVPVATIIKTAAKEIYFAFKNYKIARV